MLYNPVQGAHARAAGEASTTSFPASAERLRSPREVAHQEDDQAQKDETDGEGDNGDAELGRARPQEKQQNQCDDGKVQPDAEGHPAHLRAHRATSTSLGPAGAEAVAAPVNSRTMTWQATARRSPTATSSGRMTSHSPSSKSGQRGWKGQPLGRCSRLGMSMLRSLSFSLVRVRSGSASGRAVSSARV